MRLMSGQGISFQMQEPACRRFCGTHAASKPSPASRLLQLDWSSSHEIRAPLGIKVGFDSQRPRRKARRMEQRLLGRSGFKVPVLCLGTATFGSGPGFTEWGALGVKEATRLVDLCLEAGVTMFD